MEELLDMRTRAPSVTSGIFTHPFLPSRAGASALACEGLKLKFVNDSSSTVSCPPRWKPSSFYARTSKANFKLITCQRTFLAEFWQVASVNYEK